MASISQIAGIPVDELKILESEFLSFTKYELYVSEDLIEKYFSSLEQFNLVLDQNQRNKPTFSKDQADSRGHECSQMKSDEANAMEVDLNEKVAECIQRDRPITNTPSLDGSLISDPSYRPTISFRSVRMNKEPADMTPSSVIQNMDVYSNFYEEDPEDENSPRASANSIMTVVNDDDLEEEEFLPYNVLLR